MVPSFNTAGPCFPDEHYMLPPERRLGRIMRLIDDRKYFTIHAGHQTGKTTLAQWLVRHYNQGGPYACVWIDIQTARENPDPGTAFRTLLNNFERAFRRDLPALALPDKEALLSDPRSAVLDYLGAAAEKAERPLVVLIDEADGLIGETVVSFLTQLRQGYLDRRVMPFPHSVALIGRRQVRDYVLTQKDRQAVSWLGSASPFNVTAEAATLSPFSADEVAELLGQHTQATGQPFLAEAIDRIYTLSCGHPWLVNAIADQIVNRDVEDRAIAITRAHVDTAKETIILERRSHIDSLIARLREPRVRRILQPMLIGTEAPESDTLDDDFSYVMGLGLLVKRGPNVEIANPIYKEVIPRVLTYYTQVQLRQETAWYVRPDGSLDLPKMMAAWQEFWRKDGHVSAAGFSYQEAGPHLMLMAFLQRIINGGGQIEREYALGRGALDLLICWQKERHVIEVKLRRDTETEKEALDQIGGYLDTLGLRAGWLVLFDLRKRRSWKEKLKIRKRRHGEHQVWVVGC